MGLTLDELKQGLRLPVTGSSVLTVGPVQVPGIGTGAGYTTGFAFGTEFAIPVPPSGLIQAVRFFDLNNSKINKEIWCFNTEFAPTTDNAAWAPSNAALGTIECIIPVSTWYAANANAMGIGDALAIAFNAPNGVLYCQCVTRGADNIASGKLPLLALRILPD